MKLDPTLQRQILAELCKEQRRAAESMNSQTVGTNLFAYDKGRLQGFTHAIHIISSWNDPNHGKVVAKPATSKGETS
jgi:hypothetical protein